MQIQKLPIWQSLQQQQTNIAKTNLITLFDQDPKRFDNFSLQMGDLLLDFSKQLVTKKTIQQLCELACACDLPSHIQSLLSGKIVNKTENRSAEHSALRALQPRSEVKAVLDKMENFIINLKNKKLQNKKNIKNIISLGIGGSDLGPRMACLALENYKTTDLNIFFISNTDGNTIENLLAKLDPEETLCIVNSKTFTTIETIQNAKTIKSWLVSTDHMLAVTANIQEALNFGINKNNIFAIWDWVGGRYSIWSAVGLPIAISIGMKNFKEFLYGANAMDQHFATAEFNKNMPVLMGLLGIWNINFFDYRTLAIIPYMDCLAEFPAYLQQLEMESNGKAAELQTAPVIWGGVGCNGQHAYMQLLHQGTQVVPIDFILSANGSEQLPEQQKLLIASCLGQSRALMLGRKQVVAEKFCPGNRPTNTIIFPKLTPYILGNLIALYEHKVFVQGIIWQIQSFDQWGVELGKGLIKELLPVISSGKPNNLDSSTQGLLKFFQQERLIV